MSGTLPSLTPEEAAQRIQDGWQILDVRLESERAEGHIEGSLHIELTSLGTRAGEIDQDRPVLVHCQGGSRAGMAAEALQAAGYQVSVIDGGMRGWKEAGLPVKSG